jgi:hypothetical protein
MLEFLDVPEHRKEKELRKAIAANLCDFILEFGKVQAMLQTLNSNDKESKRLASIRDSLLPRLMTGELSVADIDDSKFMI